MWSRVRHKPICNQSRAKRPAEAPPCRHVQETEGAEPLSAGASGTGLTEWGR